MNWLCPIVMTAAWGWPLVLIAQEARYARPTLLMEPSDLAMPDVAKDFIVLDARRRSAYDESHVPGAFWVDHDTWQSKFGDGKDFRGWSRLIGKLGIDSDSSVVVYDDQAMKNAARIWWLLRYWGVDDVRLLDGGWKQWTAQNFPTESSEPSPRRTVSFSAEPRTNRLAAKDQVLDFLKSGNVQIIDARSEAEFCGTEPGKNKRSGAIPGAKHLEWSDLVDQQTHRFQSADKLEAIFKEAGVDLRQPAVTHCQSGGRASVMAFGLELMGATDVRNYYRGWSEWGNLDETPIEPGKKDKQD
jgi:thiosulfate/3-mercaptopyruvate sulfurtransferase